MLTSTHLATNLKLRPLASALSQKGASLAAKGLAFKSLIVELASTSPPSASPTPSTAAALSAPVMESRLAQGHHRVKMLTIRNWSFKG